VHKHRGNNLLPLVTSGDCRRDKSRYAINRRANGPVLTSKTRVTPPNAYTFDPISPAKAFGDSRLAPGQFADLSKGGMNLAILAHSQTSPDSNPICIEKLSGKRDEEILLHAMGTEAANVHLGEAGKANRTMQDLQSRESDWLRLAKAVGASGKNTEINGSRAVADRPDWSHPVVLASRGSQL